MTSGIRLLPGQTLRGGESGQIRLGEAAGPDEGQCVVDGALPRISNPTGPAVIVADHSTVAGLHIVEVAQSGTTCSPLLEYHRPIFCTLRGGRKRANASTTSSLVLWPIGHRSCCFSRAQLKQPEVSGGDLRRGDCGAPHDVLPPELGQNRSHVLPFEYSHQPALVQSSVHS